MADLIQKEYHGKTYKGTTVGPVSNAKFKNCHFEDSLILPCHTCRFDGCTFLRCETTSFSECVITFCRFDETDVLTGSSLMLQDCIFKNCNLTDDSKGFMPGKVSFYSTELELMPFLGEHCYINGNHLTDGSIKVEGPGHTLVANIIDNKEPDPILGVALSTGPINL